MLIMGVFMMFYVVQQRVWVMIPLTPDDREGNYHLLVAGMANRNEADFDRYFVDLNDRLQQAIPALKI